MEEEFTLMTPKYPCSDKYEDITFEPKEYKIPTNRPVRIYCDGIFDVLHYGHTRLFSQVKGMFPNVHLVIGVNNDEETIKNKGSIVMFLQERVESVRACRDVDEVIESAPWLINTEFLKKYNIDFVAHDAAPYPQAGISDVYSIIKNMGIFIPTKRALNISTTGLITRVIKDYELYLRRQIRRGISYKDLNISLLKREKIRLEETVISDVELMKSEFKYALRYWEKVSRKMIEKFKSKFFKNKSKCCEKAVM